MRAFKLFQLIMVKILIGSALNLSVYAADEVVLSPYSPESLRTSALLVLPHGIMAGEFDARAWNTPYNGLYLSKDLGANWENMGLGGRGITDIASSQRTVFVATYYRVDGTLGLFISFDGGRSFKHAGLNFSASQVETQGETVFLGGYSHGLWISNDGGLTWQQKIGDGTGWTGPNITSLTAGPNVVLAATPTKVYRSLDRGITWSEISFLAGKQISCLYINNGFILAGTQNNDGLFRSMDNGQNWTGMTNWGSHPVGNIVAFKESFYAQKVDQNNFTYKLFRSEDRGLTWLDTNVEVGQKINSSGVLFSYPAYIFLSTQTGGIFRYDIPYKTSGQKPFLRIPWAYESENELTSKVTAYFDHKYPLLGYSLFPESPADSSSTVSFLGFGDNVYELHYSSHNGTDFALPLDKEILSAASGWARYTYCAWCGHTITIDHENGFRTTYMHLQQEELVTNASHPPIWVEPETIIGKVGMTGRTTGPHLHFGVSRDLNGDGVFSEFPDGQVDPYSWLDPYNQDPWEALSWQDAGGHHTGAASPYLWSTTIPAYRLYITEQNRVVSFGGKTITFDLGGFDKNAITATIANFIRPYLPASQLNLTYIENTSLSISAKDHYENDVTAMDGGVNISFDLTKLDLSKAIKETLKLYSWDKALARWINLPSNLNGDALSATTNHLSNFILLGEKIYPLLPTSLAELTGLMEDDYFTKPPLISLHAQDPNNTGIKAIYYSLNGGLDWNIYTSAFYLEKEGISILMHRTEDLAGNLSETVDQVIKVDTQHKWKDKITVVGTAFSTVAD